MEIQAHGLTDIGRVRQNNEDAFLIDDELGAYAVCDGLGGHRAGETAARIAIETVQAALKEAGDEVTTAVGSEDEHKILREVVRRAVEKAGQAVWKMAKGDPELSGMGCTLTVLLVSGSKGAMAHVGDSRLYLQRDGATWQLSRDHTMAADMVRRGLMTPEAMRDHHYSNALSRALGMQEFVDSDKLILDILPDDRFLLCTDGLTNKIEGLAELNTFLGSEDLPSIPGQLVELANKRGGEDNITVVTIAATASHEEQAKLGAFALGVRSGLSILRELEPFKGLRFVDFVRIYNIARAIDVDAGNVVYEAGHDLTGVYVPVTGSYVLEGDGRDQKIGPGDPIGLTSLLVPRKARRKMTATESGRIIWIHGEDLMELAQRRLRLGVRVLSSLSRLLSEELQRHGHSLKEIPDSPPDKPWWSPSSWL